MCLCCISCTYVSKNSECIYCTLVMYCICALCAACRLPGLDHLLRWWREADLQTAGPCTLSSQVQEHQICLHQHRTEQHSAGVQGNWADDALLPIRNMQWHLIPIIQSTTTACFSNVHVAMATLHHSPCVDMSHLYSSLPFLSGPTHSAQHEVLQWTTVEACYRPGMAEHWRVGITQRCNGGNRMVPSLEALTSITMKHTPSSPINLLP